jgi:hypothetical protein
MTNKLKLAPSDRHFIDILRGASVIRVVLMHLGLGWFFMPYSAYLGILFPILFFVSGAVSFYSFTNTEAKSSYLYKRCLGILIPFYVFMMPVAIIYSGAEGFKSFDSLLRWLFLSPDEALFPFPIGQIWFISCLLLLALFSFPIFIVDSKVKKVLVCCFILALPVASLIKYDWLLNLPMEFPRYFSKYMIFETISLAPFFLFGAIYVKHTTFFKAKVLMLVGLFLLVSWLMLDIIDRHYSVFGFSGQRSNTYIYQAFGVLLIVLSVKKYILSFIGASKFLERFLLHCNTHAFSIFILHIPILAFCEYYFKLDNLGENIWLALLRLIVVVVLSLLLAIPLSFVHKLVIKKMKLLIH